MAGCRGRSCSEDGSTCPLSLEFVAPDTPLSPKDEERETDDHDTRHNSYSPPRSNCPVPCLYIITQILDKIKCT